MRIQISLVNRVTDDLHGLPVSLDHGLRESARCPRVSLKVIQVIIRKLNFHGTCFILRRCIFGQYQTYT